MSNCMVRYLLGLALGLAGAMACSAAPRTPDKELAEQQKAIKAAVAKFVTAMSEQNVDAFVEACGVPFSHEPGKLARDTVTLRKMYKVEVEGRPPFDVHEVKRVETFKDAKARLGEAGVKGFDEVLREEDYVATVEFQRRGRKYPSRLLFKLEDGKPKVVGWRPGSGD
jgi:hypothetical protein